MEEKLDTVRKPHPFAAILCGAVSVFLLMGLGSWLGVLSALAAVLVGSGTFLLAGAIGCALIPQRPFRAALLVASGVFVGIILHIIIFPTLNGYERNLFPIEIAANTLWAAACCFLVAALWKLGSRFLMSEKSSA
jgi:hypothetical protein